MSFEPNKVQVQLDDVQLQLEPGQTVIPHGSDDRYFEADEVIPGQQR